MTIQKRNPALLESGSGVCETETGLNQANYCINNSTVSAALHLFGGAI
jgi:hypothetical protein